MDKNSNIPIVLFTYARPEHLKQTLEGLRINRVPLIYAFSDGPKDESKVKNVQEARKILRNADWSQIIITEREINLGLGTSIRTGVTEVFKKYDKLIVLEDDIVMRPGAYEITCAALNYYENDDRIMTISMWNHPVMVPKKAKSGFFSERFMCWGWGTYKRYWDLFSNSIDEIYNSIDENLKNKINEYGKDLFLQVEYSKRADIWYSGYAMLHFKLKKMSFFPNETLVINIGKDETAENDGPGKTSYLENYKLINSPVSYNCAYDFPEPELFKITKKLFYKYFFLKHPLLKRIWLSFKKKLYFIHSYFKIVFIN